MVHIRFHLLLLLHPFPTFSSCHSSCHPTISGNSIKAPTHNKRSGVWVWAYRKNGTRTSPKQPKCSGYLPKSSSIIFRPYVRHIQNTKKFGIPVVVAINQFPTDTPAETQAIIKASLAAGAEDAVFCTHHSDGTARCHSVPEHIHGPVSSECVLIVYLNTNNSPS